ncbi:MAG TPA: MOSC domain-containing protein [Methylomirabilota bacterium]|jgi:MOSC domain-containing protein YiiM|nr:MOSC domain-containing protein [Methylomirabilota bacterium]
MHRPTETWQGSVVSIHVTPEAGAPMVTVPEARAVPGQGLEGDRYATGRGHYSPRPSEGGREITLIETEAVEALDVKLTPAETRRNVATRGVPLNDLVGRVFRVGDVRLRGTRLCEPCTYLEGLLARPGVMAALVHRGGLRAQVLEGGTIRVGDVVRPD